VACPVQLSALGACSASSECSGGFTFIGSSSSSSAPVHSFDGPALEPQADVGVHVGGGVDLGVAKQLSSLHHDVHAGLRPI
jgi:hypothetical protein